MGHKADDTMLNQHGATVYVYCCGFSVDHQTKAFTNIWTIVSLQSVDN